jgi:hypothetical protein
MRANVTPSDPGGLQQARIAMRMRVEVEGNLDERNARRVMEALEAFGTGGCVRLDFRRMQRAEPEVLVGLLDGLDALELAELRCEGVKDPLRLLLQALGRDPFTLQRLHQRT